jgi:hypothetical protein
MMLVCLQKLPKYREGIWSTFGEEVFFKKKMNGERIWGKMLLCSIFFYKV